MPSNVRVTMGRLTRGRAELILDGVEIGTNLERTLDVTRFGSPVRSITTYRDARVAGRVHVVVELIAPSTPTVKQTADGIRWLFHGNDMA